MLGRVPPPEVVWRGRECHSRPAERMSLEEAGAPPAHSPVRARSFTQQVMKSSKAILPLVLKRFMMTLVA